MMEGQGRYIVRGEIASGSTATVFLAEDAVLRRKVALKKLHPHLLGHAEAVARFGKEAVAVASLSHENVIRVYDFGNEAGNHFLAMEYVDGASLEDLLKGGGPLPVLVSLAVFRQVLSGLAAAHEAGIVHRDIKPSNLLVDRRGIVRIADFGIAFLAEEKNITRTGSFMGTPVYSSPEQAQGLPASARSDIFSTGILFYRCLTGRLPFDGASSHAILTAIIERNPPRAIQYNRRILPGLGELVERMLAKDPGQRPDADRCLTELGEVSARHELASEPDRIRRYMEEGAVYAEVEGRELRDHFLRAALRKEEAGKTREAVKSAALAGLHAGLEAGDREAARRIAGKDRSQRRRKAALSLLALAPLIVGLSMLRGFGEKDNPDRAAVPAARPAGEDPAPAEIREWAADGAPATDQDQAGERVTLTTAVIAAGEPDPISVQVAGAVPAEIRQSPDRPRPNPPPAKSLPKKQPDSPAGAAPAGAAAAGGDEAPATRNQSAGKGIRPAASGYLVVKTNPPFARVSMEGRALGTTPFKAPIELPEGAHELLLEREGCAPLRSVVRIRAGETSLLRLVLERAGPGLD